MFRLGVLPLLAASSLTAIFTSSIQAADKSPLNQISPVYSAAIDISSTGQNHEVHTLTQSLAYNLTLPDFSSEIAAYPPTPPPLTEATCTNVGCTAGSDLCGNTKGDDNTCNKDTTVPGCTYG